MKKNIQMTALGKKANKNLIWGTVLKILLPGTGIGTLVSTVAWTEAMVDAHYHPENYPVLDDNTYRRLAGVLPKELEVSQKELDEEINKFVESVKKEMEDLRKKDKNDKDESQ